LHRLAACVLLLAIAGAPRADDAGPAQPAKDPLATARARIAAKQFDAAIDELKRVNATDNADWNNLMGYSMRKQQTPDLAAAERYYDAALRIAPAHRGALEYSGELYLMKGDLPAAQKRLATLDKACAGSCPEFRDLKQAIDSYKANGNKSASTW
jgi:Flp pilus assembly protein TadD